MEDQEDLINPPSISESTIVDHIDARMHLPLVAIAVRKLPELDREALLLYAWEDQSYAEIAEALEVPVGTIRSRIHRARGRLRELLAQSGKQRDEPPDLPAAGERSP